MLPRIRQAEVFEEQRQRLLDLAYRMLGSMADAEDIVQDAYLRFEAVAPESIEAPGSYLATIVTRLAIDRLRQLRREREHYVGPWLPEPVLADPAPTPDQHAALSESLSLAMLLLMEQLDPVERAVFLLREVFDFDYLAIAQVVDKSEANCRQLFHRARQRLAGRRSRLETPVADQELLTRQFMSAVATGDLAGLIRILADDVVQYSDSGGKAAAARRILRGADIVARFFIGVARKSPPGTTVREASINGRPGILVYQDARPTSLFQLDIDDGRIAAIYVQRNPDKLQRFPALPQTSPAQDSTPSNETASS